MNGPSPTHDDHQGDDLRPVLAAAVDELHTHEPAMRDMLGPAMAAGARMRRRRRANMAAGLAAVVVLVAGGGAYLGLNRDRAALPAETPMTVPPVVESIGPTPQSAQQDTEGDRRAHELARALKPIVEPLGFTLAGSAWVLRPVDGPFSMLTVALRNTRNQLVALTLSTGRMPEAFKGGEARPGCGVLDSHDPTVLLDYSAAICTFVGMASGTDTPVWRLRYRDDPGVVQLGPGTDIVRAQIFPRHDSPGGKPDADTVAALGNALLDTAALADIGEAVRGLAAAYKREVPFPAPPAWPLVGGQDGASPSGASGTSAPPAN